MGFPEERPQPQVLGVSQLRKAYGTNVAVQEVTFGVGRNEIVGLLGPNGAGKTTTINMILGVLEPTSGSIHIEGIDLAGEMNCNMLRVWGGGIFETDDFYDICDEMGVLVWQDFLFACAMYPEEEPFKSEVEAEARYNVARLAHHPSLAAWPWK